MKKITSLLLLFILAFTVVSCTKSPAPNDGVTTEPSDSAADPTLNSELEIRISVLSGTTGMGIAPLMKSASNGSEPLNYKISVVTAADQIAPGIIQGSIDIAAVPTNLAATLYNKTKGQIKVLCANTRGVLYLVSSDPAVKSVSDLKGKTVHVPGQGTNPEFILKHIIESNGMTVGTDVVFDYTYNSPDALMGAAAATDKVTIALLPEPKVSIACDKNKNFKAVVNITEEWNKINEGAPLYQGCIIVRKAFLESNPNEVKEFLRRYELSINEVNSDPDSAAKAIAELGIIAENDDMSYNEYIARLTIPRCNLCYVEGAELEGALTKLYEILYNITPSSVGGAVPDSEIYYKK
jgi:NitT/TauT family transport system substrate-binding protein